VPNTLNECRDNQSAALVEAQERLISAQQQTECLVQLVNVRQTCDLLTRDFPEAATRQDLYKTCMTKRGIDDDDTYCN
jgi:hypothetical protein